MMPWAQTWLSSCCSQCFFRMDFTLLLCRLCWPSRYSSLLAGRSLWFCGASGSAMFLRRLPANPSDARRLHTAFQLKSAARKPLSAPRWPARPLSARASPAGNYRARSSSGSACLPLQIAARFADVAKPASPVARDFASDKGIRGGNAVSQLLD